MSNFTLFLPLLAGKKEPEFHPVGQFTAVECN
jgi:hypothetical protein